MSSSAPDPVRRPDLNWERGSVSVREPAESAKADRPPSPRSVGLIGRVRRLAQFLYRLLTETP